MALTLSTVTLLDLAFVVHDMAVLAEWGASADASIVRDLYDELFTMAQASAANDEGRGDATGPPAGVDDGE